LKNKFNKDSSNQVLQNTESKVSLAINAGFGGKLSESRSDLIEYMKRPSELSEI
jgi:hypothetical protein